MGEDGRDTQEWLKPPSQWKSLAPALESLILRMLSEKPQDRGLAGELAATMEAMIEAEAGELVSLSDSRMPTEVSGLSASVHRHGKRWRIALLPVVAGLLILASVNLNLDGLWGSSPGMTEGGTGGVADQVVAELPVPSMEQEPELRGLKLEMPEGPLPGQRRPPCPRNQINIKGGCWAEIVQLSPPCGESFYDWKGACYVPVAAPLRPNTSEKP